MRNEVFLKMRVSEIRVNQIPVNQGLGVLIKQKKCLSEPRFELGISDLFIWVDSAHTR